MHTPLAALFVGLGLALLCVVASEANTLVSPGGTCASTGAVFNPSTWSCEVCPGNSSRQSGGDCECNSGFAFGRFSEGDALSIRCVDCASQSMAVSTLRTWNGSQTCMPCGGDTSFSCLSDATFNATSARCTCPTGSVLVESVGSVSLTAQMCAACPNEECASCAFPYVATDQGSCTCSTGFSILYDGSCIPTETYNRYQSVLQTSAFSMNLENIDNSGATGRTTTVQVARTYAVDAAAACGAGNHTACNFLANLCVLMQYRTDSAPCALYLDLLSQDACGDAHCERPASLPWLYYQRSSADILNEGIADNVRLSAQQPLDFVLAEYALNGIFIGFRKLVSQLNPCRLPNTEASRFFLAGDTRTTSCLANYSWYLFAPRTSFFEAFLVNPANASDLIAIPAIVDYSNTHFDPQSSTDPWIYRDAATSATTPAADGYRRRFYLYDNVGGASDPLATTDAPTLPSYATAPWAISILIALSDKSRQVAPLRPLVVLQYATVDFASVQPPMINVLGNISEQPLANTRGDFTIEVKSCTFYVASTRAVTRGLMITLIVLSSISFVTAWVRTYGWMRRRQNLVLDIGALFRFLVYLCSHISNAYFLVVAIASWYLLIAYKSQHWLATALQGQEAYVNAMLYTAVVTKGVTVLYGLAEQCNADYFVIDWERSKGQLLRENKIVPVSMWRSTFLANELNELQMLRYFHPLLTMVLVLLFLVGLQYGNLSASTPHGTRHIDDTLISYSVLRIAVDTFFFTAISLVLYLLEYQIYYRFVVVHPLQTFVDLCSVSNISVMILLEPLFGFYIHGESIHAHADVSMEEFQRNLGLEAEGNLPVRGLGGQSQCQTFEVFMGPYTRQYLYMCYVEMELKRLETQGKALRPVNPSQWHLARFLVGFSRKPQVHSPAILAIRDRINKAFQNSVRRAESSLLSKFLLQRLVDFPPNVLYLNGPQSGDKGSKDLFFIDDVKSYGKAFMCGLDFDIFVLYATLFAAIDSSLNNVFAALVLTYVVEFVLSFYRHREGLANLSSKTLIESLFFL